MNPKITHFMGTFGHWLVLAMVALHAILNKTQAMTPELTTSIQMAIAGLSLGNFGGILHSAIVQKALAAPAAVQRAADAVAAGAQQVSTVAGAVAGAVQGAKS